MPIIIYIHFAVNNVQHAELGVLSQTSKISISSDENCKKRSIEELKMKQISIPEYCLDMIVCALNYLYRKTAKLEDTDTHIITMQVSFVHIPGDLQIW